MSRIWHVAGQGPVGGEDQLLTAAGRALIDDADATAQIATLGLDADIATLSLPANVTISAAGKSLIDDATAADQLETLGLTASAAELNQLDGKTITAAGAALLDDASATVQIATLGLDADIATLALPANTTITAAGAAILDDANAAAQLATLGLTATAAELNALDGITATVTELNYTDGVTSGIQAQINAKAAAAGLTNVDNTSDATKNAAAVTVTNHRFTRRVDTQATTDTITPEISTYDIFIRSAQAHALVINNHSSSTPVDGDMMLFEILSDATIRAITYGDKYVAKAGVALPAATVASKNLTMLFIWRNDLSQWVLLSAGQEA